ncbi:hypothetical protein BIW11_01944 [Tropilaelaps mercedesae]|uniref:Cytochrome c oxidase assembly factor 7-like n=1 Tax=Tropilaelaps mercedesae TaxID=418985 RepID=A0A1V9X608_9ACAR|nr:hypothetical protein BIW11_01944 [Tropilaelaps mercedesae]
MPYNMKDEEEVKEFLENLGIEYRFSCFKERKATGCHLLGDYMESIKRDYVKAAKVYKENCDERHYGHSCFKYATYCSLGRGTPEDKAKSFEYAMKACEANYADGCFLAGASLTDENSEKTKVSESDMIRGVDLLKRACELGSHHGCHFASARYIEGSGPITKDMKQAFELAIKACDLGNIYACSNVALMYRKGLGVAKDEAKAKFYREKVLDYQEQMKRMRTLRMEEGLDPIN